MQNCNTNLILPPLSFAERWKYTFGDSINIADTPLICAALQQWIRNIPFELHESRASFSNETSYYLLPHTCQIKIFDMIKNSIDSTNRQKIIPVSNRRFMSSEVNPGYLSSGIALNFIANKLKKFTIPEHIRFISNDCINKKSDLSELTMLSKLSGNFQEHHTAGLDMHQGVEYCSPIKMMERMPNLNKISFANQNYSIEKLPFFGPGKTKTMTRISNLFGINITFYSDAKNAPYGFIQVDNTENPAPFAYEKLGGLLNSNQVKEINKTRSRGFYNSDPIGYNNQIHISDHQHIYNVLKKMCDLKFINSQFKDIDEWFGIQNSIQSIALQSNEIDISLFVKTLGRGRRLLRPETIFNDLISKLIFEQKNRFLLRCNTSDDNWEEFAYLAKNFKVQRLGQLSMIKNFISNCI